MIERYSTPEMKNHFSEDSRFRYMLQVEIAVAKIQSKMNLIPAKAAVDIEKKAKINIKKIHQIEKTTKHDVISFVSQIAESVGKNGKYIHFGLTSSDVLDTALSLQIGQALEIILSDTSILKKTLKKIIELHKKSICAGRTHGIFAEITSFGFKMAGFLSELNRCEQKIILAKKEFMICKLSGAVGTSSALPIEFEKNVAKFLNLTVEPFATQVIPRDRHAQVMMSLAFLASSLERLAIELRHLQRSEVSEVIEGFNKGQKGSSAMPHKKNPISAENITGLARLIKGYAWTAMENIPLWHERDISHSSNERIIFTDSLTLSHYIVRRMNSLLENIYIDTDRMEKNTHLLGGVLYSSHLLLHLVDKHGLSREDSYKLIQSAAHDLQPGQHLKSEIKKNKQLRKYFTDSELDQLFSGDKHKKAIQDRFYAYQKEVF